MQRYGIQKGEANGNIRGGAGVCVGYVDNARDHELLTFEGAAVRKCCCLSMTNLQCVIIILVSLFVKECALAVGALLIFWPTRSMLNRT